MDAAPARRAAGRGRAAGRRAPPTLAPAVRRLAAPHAGDDAGRAGRRRGGTGGPGRPGPGAARQWTRLRWPWSRSNPGTRRVEHRAELHFYALVETLRSLTPPFVVATYYTRTGELDTDPVTAELLAAAARRTVAGARSLLGLAQGVEPRRTPNGLCGSCAALPDCDVGRARVERSEADRARSSGRVPRSGTGDPGGGPDGEGRRTEPGRRRPRPSGRRPSRPGRIRQPSRRGRGPPGRAAARRRARSMITLPVLRRALARPGAPARAGRAVCLAAEIRSAVAGPGRRRGVRRGTLPQSGRGGRTVAAEAVDEWGRTGWKAFHWEPWFAGLAPPARAVVLAEAVSWATALWTSFDWNTPRAMVSVSGGRMISGSSPGREPCG